MASEKNPTHVAKPPGILSTLIFMVIKLILTIVVAGILLCGWFAIDGAVHGYKHTREHLQYIHEQTAAVLSVDPDYH